MWRHRSIPLLLLDRRIPPPLLFSQFTTHGEEERGSSKVPSFSLLFFSCVCARRKAKVTLFSTPLLLHPQTDAAGSQLRRRRRLRRRLRRPYPHSQRLKWVRAREEERGGGVGERERDLTGVILRAKGESGKGGSEAVWWVTSASSKKKKADTIRTTQEKKKRETS